MARCGCSSQCSCAVQAGDGVTVTGTGTAGNPYVISSGGAGLQATDTPSVDLTLLGSGTSANPWSLSAAVRIDPAAGNMLTASANGLAVSCESVQDCVGNAFGNGLAYDDAANTFSAKVSSQAGNAVSIGPDGGLFAPTGGGNPVATGNTACMSMAGNGAGTPLTASPILDPAAGQLLSCTATGLRAALAPPGCGLTGNGSAASPLAANTGAWPYACGVDANAGGVYCDTAGKLRSEPAAHFKTFTNAANTTGLNTTVPVGATLVGTATVDVTNPDPCRPALAVVVFEGDVDFTLPPGTKAAMRIGNDEYVRVFNYSTTVTRTVNHTHCSRTEVGTVIPAGATVTLSAPIEVSDGEGAAAYTRVQFRANAFVCSLPS